MSVSPSRIASLDESGAAGPGPRGGRTEGFSLVEMLVVLVILALAAGLGVPALRTVVPSGRLNAAAEALATELALLRTEAMRTGRATRLAYDPETGRFLSSRRGARALPTADLQVRVEAGAGGRTEPGEIRFLPEGGSSGGRITLAGAGGSRLLAVSRVTGLVRRDEAVP